MTDYSSMSSWDPGALTALNNTTPLVPQTGFDLSGANLPTVAQPPGAGTNFLGLSGPQTFSAALGGLQTLGSLWAAWNSSKLAKKQFNFTKDITNTNLANQIQSYNTALSDRITSRAAMEGLSPDQVSAYLAQNSLSRHPNGG